MKFIFILGFFLGLLLFALNIIPTVELLFAWVLGTLIIWVWYKEIQRRKAEEGI